MNVSTSINLKISGSVLLRRMAASLVAGLVGVGIVLSQAPSAGAAPATAGPSSVWAASSPVVPPDTPLGRQVAWLIEVSGRLPAPEAEILAHFSPPMRKVVNPAAFNQALAELSGPTGLTLLRYQELSPQIAEIVAAGTNVQWTITVSTDPDGFLMLASFKPFSEPSAP